MFEPITVALRKSVRLIYVGTANLRQDFDMGKFYGEKTNKLF